VTADVDILNRRPGNSDNMSCSRAPTYQAMRTKSYSDSEQKF
jgi:hypothetical protein